MNLGTKALHGAILGALTIMATACSRDSIEAIERYNKATKLVGTNPSGAVKEYEEASKLDPTNHQILFGLGMAYQKQEAWAEMATSLRRAATIAPEFANYNFYEGYARMKLAEGGQTDAYETAKEPLNKCIQTDPAYAECYYWLGKALLFTKDEQGAVDNFNKAIQHNARLVEPYRWLAETYLEFKLYDDAEKVIASAINVLKQPSKDPEAAGENMFFMNLRLSDVYLARHDDASRVRTLEEARTFAGEKHPEVLHALGSTYATLEPPQAEKAVQMLKAFDKKVCKTGAAKTYKHQCEETNTLLQKFAM